jgi:hypothetical protein
LTDCKKEKGESKMSAKAKSRTPENETGAVAIVETEVVLDNCPFHDDIAALAYSYWVARGFQGGSPERNWLRAEQELRSDQPQPKH